MKHAALVLVLAAAGLASCDGTRGNGPAAAPAASVTVAGKKIEVALVLTEKERRHFIIKAAAPTETSGTMLCWPRERYFKLEGERSRLSFDALLLDKAGTITEIRPFAGNDEEGVVPKVPCASALLLQPGLPGRLGVKVGDKVDFSPEVRNARPEELPVITINGVPATVELAVTEAERQHGLMFRPRMSAEDGMLFAYSYEGGRSFWMKNTLLPLDIAFFADDGTLLNVNETPMYANPRDPGAGYATSDSKGPARYVLEMNLGWFRKKGLIDGSGRVAPGTKAVIPPRAAQESE